MGRVMEGLKKLPETIASAPEETKKAVSEKLAGISGVVQIVSEGETPSEYYIEIKEGTISIKEGKHEKPSFTMIGPEDVMHKMMVTRELNATMAFMSKQYRIEGSLAEAMKLGRVTNELAKLIEKK